MGKEEHVEWPVCSGGCGKRLQPLELPSFAGGMLIVPITLCEECKARQDEDEKKNAVKRLKHDREVYVQSLVSGMVIPYSMHDNAQSNLELRELVGGVVFKDRKLTPRGVYVYGPPGAWKTRALCVCALAAARRGYKIDWLDCPVLLCEYSAAVAGGMTVAADLVERCTSPNVLIIDDFGKGVVTPRGCELLYNIINMRTVREMPIWYTANKPPSMVTKWIKTDDADYSGSIMRRIVETCTVIKATKKGGKAE